MSYDLPFQVVPNFALRMPVTGDRQPGTRYATNHRTVDPTVLSTTPKGKNAGRCLW